MGAVVTSPSFTSKDNRCQQYYICAYMLPMSVANEQRVHIRIICTTLIAATATWGWSCKLCRKIFIICNIAFEHSFTYMFLPSVASKQWACEYNSHNALHSSQQRKRLSVFLTAVPAKMPQKYQWNASVTGITFRRKSCTRSLPAHTVNMDVNIIHIRFGYYAFQ